MPKQNARRNLQRTHRRRQRVELVVKIMRQKVQRAAHGVMSFEDPSRPSTGPEAYDERIFRHGARRWTATIGIAEEIAQAERAAGWDPNP